MKALLILSLLLSPLASGAGSLEEAVADHDRHPGLGHPADGEGDHRHGDPDDRHETPDSPCHHHDGHSCCSPGAMLALSSMALGVETASGGFPPIPDSRLRLLPSARKLLHVPLG